MQVHVYDDHAGILYLENGCQIPVNTHRFTSIDDAMKKIEIWAIRNGVFARGDQIVAY